MKSYKIQWISLKALFVNKRYAVRVFNKTALIKQVLKFCRTKSIAPIFVRKKGNIYEVVRGHRRLKILQESSIVDRAPCIVISSMTDEQIRHEQELDFIFDFAHHEILGHPAIELKYQKHKRTLLSKKDYPNYLRDKRAWEVKVQEDIRDIVDQFLKKELGDNYQFMADYLLSDIVYEARALIEEISKDNFGYADIAGCANKLCSIIGQSLNKFLKEFTSRYGQKGDGLIFRGLYFIFRERALNYLKIQACGNGRTSLFKQDGNNSRHWMNNGLVFSLARPFEKKFEAVFEERARSYKRRGLYKSYGEIYLELEVEAVISIIECMINFLNEKISSLGTSPHKDANIKSYLKQKLSSYIRKDDCFRARIADHHKDHSLGFMFGGDSVGFMKTIIDSCCDSSFDLFYRRNTHGIGKVISKKIVQLKRYRERLIGLKFDERKINFSNGLWQEIEFFNTYFDGKLGDLEKSGRWSGWFSGFEDIYADFVFNTISAVELIIKPKDELLSGCQRLLGELQNSDQRVSEYFKTQIQSKRASILQDFSLSYIETGQGEFTDLHSLADIFAAVLARQRSNRRYAVSLLTDTNTFFKPIVPHRLIRSDFKLNPIKRKGAGNIAFSTSYRKKGWRMGVTEQSKIIQEAGSSNYYLPDMEAYGDGVEKGEFVRIEDTVNANLVKEQEFTSQHIAKIMYEAMISEEDIFEIIEEVSTIGATITVGHKKRIRRTILPVIFCLMVTEGIRNNNALVSHYFTLNEILSGHLTFKEAITNELFTMVPKNAQPEARILSYRYLPPYMVSYEKLESSIELENWRKTRPLEEREFKIIDKHISKLSVKKIECMVSKFYGLEHNSAVCLDIFSPHLFTVNNIYFIQQPVPMDGNCLYHAIAAQCDFTARMLRQRAAKYLSQHIQDFLHLFKNVREFNAYLVGVQRDCMYGGAWADMLEIYALAIDLDRPIVILDQEKIRPPIILNQDANTRPIFLCYQFGFHYNALYSVEDSVNIIQAIIGVASQLTNKQQLPKGFAYGKYLAGGKRDVQEIRDLQLAILNSLHDFIPVVKSTNST